LEGLSELNVNLFDKLANYMNKHDYKANKHGGQYFSSKLLPSEDTSPTNVNEVKESIVNKLVQKQKILNSEEISEMVSAYESGLTINQLAKQFCCHRTTISQHLKTQDVKIRNRLSEDLVEKAIELYESGLSCAKIGKMIRVADTTILYRLHKRGVRVRGRHDWQK